MQLEVTDGPRKGHVFDLPDECVVLVGRSRQCHLRVGRDPRCSRVHLILEVAAPKCRLRDLGTTNGTFVNGERVVETEIGAGDRVLVGRTALLLRAEPAAPEPPSDRHVPGAGQARQPVGVVARPAGFVVQPDQAPADEETTPLARCARCGERSAHAQEAPGGLVCAACQAEMERLGETVPGYRLVQQLEVGGMSLLWLAEDTRSGARVVVKTMTPELAASQRAVRMFQRESKISLGLRHANIVAFISAGQYHGQLYIVMEYVAGVDAERLRAQRGGQLGAGEVTSIGAQVLDALDYAHTRGIVHRDVKPPNILVSGDLPEVQVKVTDFGLARVYRAAGRSDITRRGDVRGSIPFMPPEQVLNCRDVDQRADIFALGATLYHLLTGEYCRNFDTRKKAALLTVIEDGIVPITERGTPVPPALADVVHRALRLDPAKRFQTAAAMREALLHVSTAS